VKAVANAAGVIVDLRDEEKGFELPGRLFRTTAIRRLCL